MQNYECMCKWLINKMYLFFVVHTLLWIKFDNFKLVSNRSCMCLRAILDWPHFVLCAFMCACINIDTPWKMPYISTNVTFPTKEWESIQQQLFELFSFGLKIYMEINYTHCSAQPLCDIILYTNCRFLQFLLCDNDYHQLSLLYSLLECSKFNLNWRLFFTSLLFLIFYHVHITSL